ncbi:MAG TPA: lipid II flippase Amj family protein [Desulfobacteria bacterium]|nr:lipid II flippase Amj family protein [Desulfobacteria bacterium]
MVLDHRLILVIIFTVIIHMIITLGYAVRLAGVRTQRLALAFSLWNVIFLVASTANTVQAPFLGRIIDEAGTLIHKGNLNVTSAVEYDIRIIILAATLGSIIGTLLIPNFVRLFTKGIFLFERVKSVPRMIGVMLRPKMLRKILAAITIPQSTSVKRLVRKRGVPKKLVVLNFLVTGIWTIGVLAALYAGLLDIKFVRTTANMSGIINGVATVMGVLLIDPHVASITDEAARGKRSDEDVKLLSFYLAASRIAGTILAQVIFIPAAEIIVMAARVL